MPTAYYEYLFPKVTIKLPNKICWDDFSEFCNTFIVPIHDLYSLLFLEQKMFLVHCMLIVCYTFFFLCCKWMLSANCLCVQKMHFEDAIIPPPLTGVMPRYYGLNLLWPYNEAEAEAASQCAQRSKNFLQKSCKKWVFWLIQAFLVRKFKFVFMSFSTYFSFFAHYVLDAH